jgi:hypothetical protein
VRLPDGRIVKLAGIDVPAGAVPDARRRLDEVLRGTPVRVVPLRAAPDRYGRIVGRVVAGGLWLEAALVESGLALANLHPGESDCFGALLEAERRARSGAAGSWAALATLAAADPRGIAAHAGRFAIVEGRVLRVGVRDYATFLDFGRRWTEDFAVVIARADRARFEAVHGDVAAFARRLVRVRGVLDPGAPPRLRVSRPEAVEVLE